MNLADFKMAHERYSCLCLTAFRHFEQMTSQEIKFLCHYGGKNTLPFHLLLLLLCAYHHNTKEISILNEIKRYKN